MSHGEALLCFRPQARARVRLVAFPWAGSSAAGLRPLADALHKAGASIELHAVAYAARAHRRHAPLPRSLDDVVDDLLPAIDALAPPLALYGHSFGAVVAFFVAQRLAMRARPPTQLVAAARVAPSVPAGSVPVDDDALLALLAGHGLIDGALFHDAEARALLLPPLRCDLRLSQQVRCADVIDVPITALRGSNDSSVDAAGVTRWRDHTRAAFAERAVDGGHLFVRDQPTAVGHLLSQVLQP